MKKIIINIINITVKTIRLLLIVCGAILMFSMDEMDAPTIWNFVGTGMLCFGMWWYNCHEEYKEQELARKARRYGR